MPEKLKAHWMLYPILLSITDSPTDDTAFTKEFIWLRALLPRAWEDIIAGACCKICSPLYGSAANCQEWAGDIIHTQDPLNSVSDPLMWEQVFKHRKLWGKYHIETTYVIKTEMRILKFPSEYYIWFNLFWLKKWNTQLRHWKESRESGTHFCSNWKFTATYHCSSRTPDHSAAIHLCR